MRTLDLHKALKVAGVVTKILPDWTVPHKEGAYVWREPDGNPAGAIWHHTATSSYTPNRAKASAYLGMGDPTLENPRLHQVGGPGRVPILTLANAYPAPISAGAGRRDVLEDYVKAGIPYVGKQTLTDDSPAWYGNTHYWNTEVILNGTGAEMPDDMWATLITVCDVLNDVMGWTPANHIGHGQHTRRKIDLRDGRYVDMAATIDAIRAQQGQDDMFTHYEEGNDYPEWEEIAWLLFLLEGGSINVNGNSGQVTQALPYKAQSQIRTVQAGDFDVIAKHTNMGPIKRRSMTDDGLYRFGIELASLRESAWT